jgi:hypothetical protein
VTNEPDLSEETRFRGMGLSKDEVKRALDPMRSFRGQLEEEVASYERLKRGQFDELHNFNGLGRMLVALRVYRGISQRDFAASLEVHESQVSRDERNEYNGVTVERARSSKLSTSNFGRSSSACRRS